MITLYLLAASVASVWLAGHFPGSVSLGLMLGVCLGTLIYLVRRYPLFGWFLSGFIFGLLGSGRRRY